MSTKQLLKEVKKLVLIKQVWDKNLVELTNFLAQTLHEKENSLKKCKQCGISKHKDLFYPNRAKCKECIISNNGFYQSRHYVSKRYDVNNSKNGVTAYEDKYQDICSQLSKVVDIYFGSNSIHVIKYGKKIFHIKGTFETVDHLISEIMETLPSSYDKIVYDNIMTFMDTITKYKK